MQSAAEMVEAFISQVKSYAFDSWPFTSSC